MASLRTLFLCCVLSLVHCSVIVERASNCVAADIAYVKSQVTHASYFCTWYNSDGRTRSPLASITQPRLTAACECIIASSPRVTIGTSKVTAGLTACGTADKQVITNEFKDAKTFCQFFNAFPRTDTPVPGKSPTQVTHACNCVILSASSARPASSSTRRSSSISSLKSSSASSKRSSSSIRISSSSSRRTSTTSSRQSTVTTSRRTTSPSTSSKRSSSSIASSSSTKKPLTTIKSSSTSRSSAVSTSSRKSSSSATIKTSSKISSSVKISPSLPSLRSTTSSVKQSSSSSKTSSASSKITSSSSFKTSSASTRKSSSTSSSTKSSSVLSTAKMTSSTTRDSICKASPTATLLPVANADKNRNSLSNLVASNNAILNYAESSPGTNAASVNFTLLYPAVVLEDSAFVQNVTCSGRYLTLKLSSETGVFAAVQKWPKSNLVLITNTDSCNKANERGVYMVSDYLAKMSDSTVQFKVTPTKFDNIARSMKISYGSTVARSPVQEGPTSTCSATYTNVATSAPTAASNATVAYDELDPDTKALVDSVVSKLKYDKNGNVLVTSPDAMAGLNGTTSLPVADWQPNNATLQAALQKALDDAGLSDPADMIKNVQDGLGDSCGAPSPSTNATSPTVVNPNDESSSSPSPTSANLQRLMRRDWDDYLCNDFVGAFTGDYGEAACGAIDLYKNRDAIKCLFTSCYTTTTVTYHRYTYTFSQDWTASFGLPSNSAVVSFGDGSKLKCVDCGLSLAHFKLAGQIVYVYETQALEAATLTVTEQSTTRMVYELDAKNPVAYNWTTALSLNDLSTLSVENVFSLKPNIVFSMGVQFSTDSAISVQGGAVLNVGNAAANIDLASVSTTGVSGWAPSLQMTYPTFSTASKVQLVPYIRRSFSVAFSVLGKTSSSIAFTSETALGFNSQMLDTNGQTCAAGTLQLKSYLYNKNAVNLGGQFPQPLNTINDKYADRCFKVPSNKPSLEEIASLRSVGQEFCTAYIGYRQPTSGRYLVSTTTTPTTVSSTTTLTVEAIPTSTITTSTTLGQTRVVYATAYATAGAGEQSLQSAFLKRAEGDYVQVTTVDEPAQATSGAVARRDANAPAMVSDWPATKISYACSQIATGVFTSTIYTSTATQYSDTVTSTFTDYTATVGQAVTETSMLTAYAWQTTTAVAATSTLAASCPLQTQVSCFTINGQGHSNIAGKNLGVKQGVLNPSFENAATSFYLTCDGSLVSLPDLRVLRGPDGATQMLSFGDSWNSSTPRAVCKRDATSKQLTCSYGDNDIMYVWNPSTPYWTDKTLKKVSPRDDAGLWIPTWGSSGDDYFPISLGTTDVTCPCEAQEDSEPLASVQDTVPSCPASDGTRFQTSDGTNWQVQCDTNYDDTVKSSTSTSSLASCVESCRGSSSCTGVVWNPDNNQCDLKASMLSDSYSSSTKTHSVIRLANLPECASPGSNIIVNGGFETGNPSPWAWSPYGIWAYPAAQGVVSPGANSGLSYRMQYNDEGTSVLSQNVNLVAGVTYTFSGNYMSNRNAASSIYCYLDWARLNMVPGWLSSGQLNQWQYTSTTYTPSRSGQFNIQCYFGAAKGGQLLYIDNMSLVCS